VHLDKGCYLGQETIAKVRAECVCVCMCMCVYVCVCV
jgi:hypothetical protein